ncbi:MAG: hypothetical protein MZW92_06555 [Comamonadaceae bacterium]|nr:hypothetical protein [Comamonadaceae bacterium]
MDLEWGTQRIINLYLRLAQAAGRHPRAARHEERHANSRAAPICLMHLDYMQETRSTGN